MNRNRRDEYFNQRGDIEGNAIRGGWLFLCTIGVSVAAGVIAGVRSRTRKEDDDWDPYQKGDFT